MHVPAAVTPKPTMLRSNQCEGAQSSRRGSSWTLREGERRLGAVAGSRDAVNGTVSVSSREFSAGRIVVVSIVAIVGRFKGRGRWNSRGHDYWICLTRRDI